MPVVVFIGATRMDLQVDMFIATHEKEGDNEFRKFTMCPYQLIITNSCLLRSAVSQLLFAKHSSYTMHWFMSPPYGDSLTPPYGVTHSSLWGVTHSSLWEVTHSSLWGVTHSSLWGVTYSSLWGVRTNGCHFEISCTIDPKLCYIYIQLSSPDESIIMI